MARAKPIRRYRSARISKRNKRLYIHFRIWTSKRTGRRARLTRAAQSGVREVVNNDTKFTYELFFYRVFSEEQLSFGNKLSKWAKVNFAGEYKIHRFKHWNNKRYPDRIKLSEDSDLMIFMLMYKDKVRKVFRYVKEPV